MGARGPVPKRSSQRRRRNKDSKPEKASVLAKVKQPVVNGNWHPAAKAWYRSLAESGQAQFYEPSDWQQAKLLAGEISDYLRSKRKSAMMWSHIWSAMNDLLSSEGARRRVKLEVERGSSDEGDKDGDVADLDEFRKRAAAG